MELIEKINEDEMISDFLKAEYFSERFGEVLRKLVEKHGAKSTLITKPNLKNASENKLRKQLLADHRGYGKNQKIFENFPNDVLWYKAFLTAKEVTQAKYIAYNYWIKISDGSRLAKNAVKNIQAGRTIFNESNDRFFAVAKLIKKGTNFPRLIFLAQNQNSSIVILEGHVRLTAYMLVPTFLPKPLEVIIGFSENIKKWDLY